jgi:hypothetical protein
VTTVGGGPDVTSELSSGLQERVPALPSEGASRRRKVSKEKGLHDKRDSLVPLESTDCGLPLHLVEQDEFGHVLYPTANGARVSLFDADRGLENAPGGA